MKLVLGVYDYPPHPYHYNFIDDTWEFSDIVPRNPKVLKVDATAIPFTNLEAIYASHLLEHIYDTQKTLIHWYECLAPNGYVIINVPDIEWVLNNVCKINAGLPSDSSFYTTAQHNLDIIYGAGTNVYDRHLNWFTMKKLRKQLKVAGFKNIKIRRDYEAHLMQCLIAYAKKPEV